MALSCIISEIKRDIGWKSWFFHTPLAFDTPVEGVPTGISPSRLVWKNENGGATWRWKNIEDMCNRLDTIPACDGQTDRQTDRQTDIFPRHSPRYAYASHNKESTFALYYNKLTTYMASRVITTCIYRICTWIGLWLQFNTASLAVYHHTSMGNWLQKLQLTSGGKKSTDGGETTTVGGETSSKWAKCPGGETGKSTQCVWRGNLWK